MKKHRKKVKSNTKLDTDQSKSLQQEFLAYFHDKHFTKALGIAKKLASEDSQNAFSWRALGTCHLELKQLALAIGALEKAISCDENDFIAITNLAGAHFRNGDPNTAIAYQRKAIALDPNYAQARYRMAEMLQSNGCQEEAIEHIKIAEELGYDEFSTHLLKAILLYQTRYFTESLVILENLNRKFKSYHVSNNLGNIYKDIGLHELAQKHYREALDINPKDPMAYSNLYFSMHYSPSIPPNDILKFAEKWEALYSLDKLPEVPLPDDRSFKPLKVGLLSSGFRLHPVGQMISRAINNLDKSTIELYAYTKNNTEDFVTDKIKQSVESWQNVSHLEQKVLANKIREDRIDILIDLSGHGEGSCFQAISMRPAPLCVKWVGGLVNTMGLSSIDYLISDSVETPEGVDASYVEKLIRMPDDYICYEPIHYMPAITALPSLKNGYITFGSFNNPAKINSQLLAQWAEILQSIANSRLFLKGFQYENADFCEKIYAFMESKGITRDRILLEGPSKHKELLESYNRIDIALDTWPYSGGLTTCESLMMGVPVVTLPGPTFAGRHSATHLVNAGMPELVVENWDDYRARVIELASDLPNLAVIRACLRTTLMQSPVCDGPRFGKHLTKALHAIWQRYCEGKAPAALTFNKGGQAWFENEDAPVKLPQHLRMDGEGFEWPLESTITVLDNGANLASRSDAEQLLGSGHIAILAFDPIERLSNVATLSQYGELHHYPQVTLGDGQPVTLLIGGDIEGITSLEPLPSTEQATHQAHPVASIALDSIEGLESIDLLVLDDRHDSLKILQHGTKALRDTLLIQARVRFNPTHANQPDLGSLTQWAAQHGFSFYRLHNAAYHSYFPEDIDAQHHQATELVSADVLLLPNKERVKQLTNNQNTKLAFLLHKVYRIKDLTFYLLNQEDSGLANIYLTAEGIVHQKSPAKADVTDQQNDGTSFDIPDAPFMTDNERALFKKYLKDAARYFEFGSGGSTVWAVNRGLSVRGVESDDKWVSALKSNLGGRCQIEAVDVGPTGDWGFPTSTAHKEKFPSYSRAIHNHDIAFDFVLVDGRFRVACTIAAIEHIIKHHEDISKARIFIHDFWNRPQYHIVLQYLDSVESTESAGVFRVKSNLSSESLNETWDKYAYNPA